MTSSDRIGMQKYTQKAALAAAARHEMLFAGRMGGARAVFAFCDLSGLDLSANDLADADFTGALLEEINLAASRLASALFVGADLRRANLSAATLNRAEFRGACLNGANLIGADLYEADFRAATTLDAERFRKMGNTGRGSRPAELRQTLFSSANLERSKMTGIVATEADFSGAIMKGCALSDADLADARLAGANLEGADLSGCNLRGADLRNAILVAANLSGTILAGANLAGALTDRQAMGASLCASPVECLLDAHARWAETGGLEGRPADLSGVDMRTSKSFAHRNLSALVAPGATLYGVDLCGAALQGSNFQDADLRGARLTGADLRGVNFTGAKLDKADMRDANFGPLLVSASRLLPTRLDGIQAHHGDFRGADLRGARFLDADLSFANLSGADLRETELGGAILTGAKLPAMLVLDAAALASASSG